VPPRAAAAAASRQQQLLLAGSSSCYNQQRGPSASGDHEAHGRELLGKPPPRWAWASPAQLGWAWASLAQLGWACGILGACPFCPHLPAAYIVHGCMAIGVVLGPGMPAGLLLSSPPPWLPAPPGGAAGSALGRALCGRLWGGLAAKRVGLPPQRAAFCVCWGSLQLGALRPPSLGLLWWQQIAWTTASSSRRCSC
jgi:hypothetical protein